MLWKLLVDSFQAGSVFFPLRFFKTGNSGSDINKQNKTKQQQQKDSGTHDS